MPVYISVEKIKEVVRLAERAHDQPEGRADDPQRGGPAGSEGLEMPATPPEPQPAEHWREAFTRYIEDLPDAALDEMISLYRLGGGAPGQVEEAVAAPSSSDASAIDRVAFLTSRPDLTSCLKSALERL